MSDYVAALKLDVSSNFSYSSSQGHTYNKSNSKTSIDGYTLVEYSNIGGGDHVIYIGYIKNYMNYKYDDRGYLLIPKDQE
jgi:hypothetical protein